MSRNFRHLVALGTTLLALASVVTGGWVTSAKPLPGLETVAWQSVHRILSLIVVAGAIGLSFLVSGRLRNWLIGSVLLVSVPGGLLEAHRFVQIAGLLHAVGASILFSVSAVAALILGSGWEDEAQTIPDEGSPSLVTLAKATWVGLLIQTGFGALYRHQILGLVPHVAGAMLAMGMVMFAGIAAFSTKDAPAAIKAPAMTLLLITGLQMVLGLGAYLYRMEYREQATGQSAMLTLTVIHVAVGALTTACSALMGMQISRYVRSAVAVAR